MHQELSSNKQLSSIMHKLLSEKEKLSINDILKLASKALHIIDDPNISLPVLHDSLRNELYETVGKAVQSQIKCYMNDIKKNIDKYWNTQSETALLNFLNDIKTNWNELRPFFSFATVDAAEWLTDASLTLLNELHEQRYSGELEELLDAIGSEEKYWPTQKAEKVLQLAKYLHKEKEVQEQLEQLLILNTQRAIEISDNLEGLVNVSSRYPILNAKTCPQELKQFYRKRYDEFVNSDINITMNALLEEIENVIRQSGYWPTDLELKFVTTLIKNTDEQKKAVNSVKLFKLFNTFKSTTGDINTILLTKFPELKDRDNYVPVDFTEDGEYNLFAFNNKEWIPAYYWKDQDLFPKAVFKQKGEWVKRKFKCEYWTLSGEMLVGTFLLVSSKKDKRYFIVTNDAQKSINSLREVEITDYDLLGLSSSQKPDNVQNQAKQNISLPLQQSAMYKFFSNTNMVKIGLQFANEDKNQVSMISKLVWYSLNGNSQSLEIIKQLYNLIFHLRTENAIKYLNFIQENVPNPPPILKNFLTQYDNSQKKDRCFLCNEKSIHTICSICKISLCSTCAEIFNHEENIYCPGTLLNNEKHPVIKMSN